MATRHSPCITLVLVLATLSGSPLARAGSKAMLALSGTVESRMKSKMEPSGPKRFRFTYSTNSTTPLLIEAHKIVLAPRAPARAPEPGELVLKRTLESASDGVLNEATAQSALELPGMDLVITITAQ